MDNNFKSNFNDFFRPSQTLSGQSRINQLLKQAPEQLKH